MYSGLNHLHRNTQRRHYGGATDAAPAAEPETKDSLMAKDDNVKPHHEPPSWKPGWMSPNNFFAFTAKDVPAYEEKETEIKK